MSHPIPSSKTELPTRLKIEPGLLHPSSRSRIKGKTASASRDLALVSPKAHGSLGLARDKYLRLHHNIGTGSKTLVPPASSDSSTRKSVNGDGGPLEEATLVPPGRTQSDCPAPSLPPSSSIEPPSVPHNSLVPPELVKTNHMNTSFADYVAQDPNNNAFALDFAVPGPDVYENFDFDFDFDSFLHNTEDNQGFSRIDFMSTLGNDGIEAGAE
ncbi:hypothetical protein FKW77_001925 [Venturia effusa]|uniref:Uncharacterized protein n=1 Tax=Venturia effusa TaxID=50376 RepID=A0A517LBX2_9PEZI|nr:hypothetical protein FKW77_001925 [Venturia effusa]